MIKTTALVLASVSLVNSANEVPIKDHFFESFLETDATMGQRLKRAEAEASKQAKLAEEAWEKSRRETDSLLQDVHKKMASLNADLEKTSKQQKTQLAMIEKSRETETAALASTERKLKQLKDQSEAKENSPVVSSFITEDFLAPLRKAAAEAKAFAEKIRQQTSGGASSFVQEGTGEDFAAKADRSLSLAQQALSKLDNDLEVQKRELQAETAQAQKDQQALREAAGIHASFLQTGEAYDPLSPQALAEWREKFTAQLEKARKAAGLTGSFHSSLVQLDTSTDEKLRDDERKVARLQEEYNNQMAKLKQDNAQLMAQAHAEIEKAKDMKSKLEADMHASSFVQQSSKFDAAKEQEHIRELQRKWERDAEKIAQPSQQSEAQVELNSLIEQQKVKQQAAEQELDRLREKLNRDIESMHKDMAINHFNTKSSFIQEDNSKDLVTRAKEAIMNIAAAAKKFTSGASAEVQTTESSTEAQSAVTAADEKNAAKTEEIPATVEESKDETAPVEATPAETTTVEAPTAEAVPASSFSQVNFKGDAETALEKAQNDLRKLQAKMRAQAASLAQFRKH